MSGSNEEASGYPKLTEPPGFIWTCRDWTPVDVMRLAEAEFGMDHDGCINCADNYTCKGPVRYRLDEG